MNKPRTAVHIGQACFILLMLSLEIFEFYCLVDQKQQLNSWVMRSWTVQIVFRAFIDMTICTVIWSLTDENSESGRKIKQLSLDATMEDGEDEETDSAASFNELINRD